MELTLSIPDRIFTGPDGINRWLIRAAMNGLMLDEVRVKPAPWSAGGRSWLPAAELRLGGEADLRHPASALAQQYVSLPRMHRSGTPCARVSMYGPRTNR